MDWSVDFLHGSTVHLAFFDHDKLEQVLLLLLGKRKKTVRRVTANTNASGWQLTDGREPTAYLFI